jgi:hypothetical protein
LQSGSGPAVRALDTLVGGDHDVEAVESKMYEGKVAGAFNPLLLNESFCWQIILVLPLTTIIRVFPLLLNLSSHVLG